MLSIYWTFFDIRSKVRKWSFLFSLSLLWYSSLVHMKGKKNEKKASKRTKLYKNERKKSYDFFRALEMKGQNKLTKTSDSTIKHPLIRWLILWDLWPIPIHNLGLFCYQMTWAWRLLKITSWGSPSNPFIESGKRTPSRRKWRVNFFSGEFLQATP